MKDKKIDEIAPHTIKKFELIENYIDCWARTILMFPKSEGIIFIDSMSNSGVYKDKKTEKLVQGTAIRAAKKIKEILIEYNEKYKNNKKAYVFFNDLSKEKIDLLDKQLPQVEDNYICKTYCKDANEFLKEKIKYIDKLKNYHSLVFYDPYQAIIDWEAIKPYLNRWGEVIINHVVSDTKRSISNAVSEDAIEKYESTYLNHIEKLKNIKNAKDFDYRIKKIIFDLKNAKNKKFFISSVPFFISTNVLIYNLIFCSEHITGLTLFKKVTWDTFGKKSSNKDTHGSEDKLTLGLFGEINNTVVDDYCYYVKDIAMYLIENFIGKTVTKKEMWEFLASHPIFPTDGYKTDIIKYLKNNNYVIDKRDYLIFNKRNCNEKS